MARLAPTYLPREPYATVLYRLVKEHGAAFRRHAPESYDAPRYVEDEWLRKRGHATDDDHASNDTPDRTFAEVLAQLAT